MGTGRLPPGVAGRAVVRRTGQAVRRTAAVVRRPGHAAARKRADARHPPPVVRAEDRGWRTRMRGAYAVSVTVLTAALLLDAANGTLGVLRALVWAGLALAVFVVLAPPRVTAGDGWLAVRGLVTRHRVATGLLIRADIEGAIGRRVVLCDATGGRVCLDPRVLLANPFLWHELDTGIRRSHAAGLLPDRTALHEIAAIVDDQEARDLLRTLDRRPPADPGPRGSAPKNPRGSAPPGPRGASPFGPGPWRHRPTPRRRGPR